MKFQYLVEIPVSGSNQYVSGITQGRFSFVRADNHSTVVAFTHFTEIGYGQYEFGTFDVPEVTLNTGTGQWTPAVVLVLPRIDGVIQAGASEIPVWNDAYIPVVTGDLFERGDKLGDEYYGWSTYSKSLSGVNGFDPFNPPNDAYRRLRLPALGWVEDKISSSTSTLSGLSFGSYLPLSGGTIGGTVTYNTGIFSFPTSTKLNATGTTANFSKITLSGLTANNGVVSIYNNLGLTHTGDHFTYGFTNTDGDPVPVFAMGCGSDEIPYIDFKNRAILNFAGSISMAGYMPLTGGVFSGSVTANGPRFVLGNTKINGQSTTADLQILTVSAAKVNNGTLEVRNNLATVTAGDQFKVVYTDTDAITHYPFAVGANYATEQPFIKLFGSLSSDQLSTSVPTSNLEVSLATTVYGDNSVTLTKPDKWLTITDSNGDEYLIPAYLKP